MDHTNGIGELAAELAQLRAANTELQAEIKELHERSAAERSEIINCLKNIAELVTQRRGLEIDLSDARAALAQAERELTKWRNWHPDDETLAVLKRQATSGSKAGYVVYIAALEQRCRDDVAALAQAQAERDAATSRAEQAEAVAAEIESAALADIVSPDTNASHMVISEAIAETCRRIRAVLAGPEGGPR